MVLVQLPEAGGHSLLWADRLRKAVGKKDAAEYDKLTEEFYETIKEKNLSINFGRYIWEVLVATSRGYGFNSSHTLAYSLIGLQEMNFAYRFPRIFWDTACLIVDSGGGEETDYWQEEEIGITYTSGPDIFNMDYEESDDDAEEDKKVVVAKTKAKPRSIDFGKIATAIGKIQSFGVTVLPPHINDSSYTFTPNIKNNTINYGLSGIAQVGEDVIQRIIENRPYTSLDDFTSRVKINKPQVIKLIKAGAFDEFGDRYEIMKYYTSQIADTKKTLNLRNMRLLIEGNFFPSELDLEVKIFNFTRYLRQFKSDVFYVLDDIAMAFYEKHFDLDLLVVHNGEEGDFKILQSKWDKIYNSRMDKIRNFIKPNHDELLSKINQAAIDEVWNKYCQGDIRTWEMDSVSFYSSGHELEDIDLRPHGVVDFQKLPENPPIDSIIQIKGKPVKLFKISRIAGSILDKDKNKGLITILTTTGVVQVRMFGALFAHYDKQISEIIEETGKKKVVEKSMFSRGNKVIFTGIRQGDVFVAKKYARTPWHMSEKIVGVDENGNVKLTTRE